MLARRMRAARSLQAVERGRRVRGLLLLQVKAVRSMQRVFHSKRRARHLIINVKLLQSAARKWIQPFFVPGRRAVLRSCYMLHSNHSNIPSAFAACALLIRLAGRSRVRLLTTEMGTTSSLLRAVGACNRSPPSLLLLSNALQVATCPEMKNGFLWMPTHCHLDVVD